MTLANVFRIKRQTTRPRPWLVLVVIACVLLTGGGRGVADAKLVRDKGDRVAATRVVFARIAEAWEAGDEQALAALVHSDGLRVTTGDRNDRVSRYSPSQAFYFFRNLFQSHRTLLFEFEMMQDPVADGPVHGMALWKRRRPDSTVVQEIKLVCVLMRQGEQWKLAEINTIR